MIRFAVRGRRLFPLGVAALLFAVLTGCGQREQLATANGHSVATKSVLLAFCASPDDAEPAPPPREVKLRRVADQWSGDLATRSKKDVEALLADLPPKYRQMVKDYFEQLEKLSREKR